MAERRLSGIIAPPYTPMHADGSINLGGIDKYAEGLVDNGVAGVFVCGSTGESMSLTTAERLEIATRWKNVIGERLPVVVHVGHTCVEDCKVLAAHAQEIGADAISAMGPCFFKPACVDDLVAFCAEVAAAAPQLPFYYYHIPVRTGVRLKMLGFLKAAAGRIPTLVGVKFSEEDLMDLSQCVTLDDGRFNILFGAENILLAGLALGVRGSIGTSFNFAAPLFQRIMNAYQAGDMATAQMEQTRAIELMTVLDKFAVIGAGKAVMRMIGLDCGPPRLPLRALTEEQYDRLCAELGRIGFSDYCLRRCGP